MMVASRLSVAAYAITTKPERERERERERDGFSLLHPFNNVLFLSNKFN